MEIRNKCSNCGANEFAINLLFCTEFSKTPISVCLSCGNIQFFADEDYLKALKKELLTDKHKNNKIIIK